MSITLTKELRDAVERQPERPLLFEDAQTHVPYVLMTGEQFQRLVYDDSDLTPDEILAAAAVSAELADRSTAIGGSADPKSPDK